MRERKKPNREEHKVAREVYDDLLKRDEMYRRQGRSGIDPRVFNNGLRRVIELNPDLTEEQREKMLQGIENIEAMGPEEPAPPYTDFHPPISEEAELKSSLLLDQLDQLPENEKSQFVSSFWNWSNKDR